MRGNYALVALSVFLGACGPFCAGALAFSPGAWRMAWRARARLRSCASAVGRRWIKGAVNERAPEDCGALRYYKRSLVKQMRREGKGWWVLKKLGGEIEVSNPPQAGEACAGRRVARDIFFCAFAFKFAVVCGALPWLFHAELVCVFSCREEQRRIA